VAFSRCLLRASGFSFLVTLGTLLLQIPRADSAPKTNGAPIVSAAMIGPLLSPDIDKALAAGGLGPPKSAGVVIGVARGGSTRVFAFGAAKPDSIFEIGSITKTFTGLLLAQMIAQGKVTLTEPLRKLLPEGLVAAPEGPQISLSDLITHHSGLPRMPDNFLPSDWTSARQRYTLRALYAYIARRGVARPPHPPYVYSNLGVGLLAQALADRAHTSYANLLAGEITGPLHMRDTEIELSAAQRPRVIPGWPEGPWHAGALAGAGDLRSTAQDMLTYLEANLDPRDLPSGVGKSMQAQTLPSAIELSQTVLAPADGPMRLAYGWEYDPRTGDYSHAGLTGGYTTYAFFNHTGGYAAIVLTNAGSDPFANLVASRISQAFSGRAANPLAK
jgi:serine-type D-Ala-D-Ala carboxypeptidase/endopeptidase